MKYLLVLLIIWMEREKQATQNNKRQNKNKNKNKDHCRHKANKSRRPNKKQEDLYMDKPTDAAVRKEALTDSYSKLWKQTLVAY